MSEGHQRDQASHHGHSESKNYPDESAADEDYEENYDDEGSGSFDSSGETASTWASLVDPPVFLAAQTDFGHCERQTLRYFLEEYLKMCWDASQTPIPQMFFLFQARNKKNLL